MELREAEMLANILMIKHGLGQYGYKFRWDNCSNRFGVHIGGKRIIGLSKKLAFLNSENQVKDTILHEIAHALDYIRNGFKHRYSGSKRLVHDQVWKDICVEIGANPERCYSAKNVNVPTNHKYRLVHTKTGKTIKKFRRRPNPFRYVHSMYRIDGIVSECHVEPI